MFYAEKARRAGRKIKRWGRWMDWTLSAAMVGGLIFVAHPGGLAALRNWRQHTVFVRIDPGTEIANIAATLNAADFRQIRCLARNMYFEAADQGEAGMKATGDVVLNRLHSGLYPDSICQIVTQTRWDRAGRPHCQFSWYCDGQPHKVVDDQRWRMAYEVAYNQYLYAAAMPDLTGGATFYHAEYVQPDWRGVTQTTKIGAHLFYRADPGHRRPRRHVVKSSRATVDLIGADDIGKLIEATK